MSTTYLFNYRIINMQNPEVSGDRRPTYCAKLGINYRLIAQSRQQGTYQLLIIKTRLRKL